MVDYVSKRICPRTILEPAAGDGRFISPLFKFNVPITAVELEEEKAKDLAGRFIKNFAKFTGNEAGKALVAAGPKL